MNITGKHVAILVHDNFEQAEFEEPLSALKDAGAEVTVISASGSLHLQGLNHVEKGDKFQADLLLDEAESEDYDALVLPGGAVNADALRAIETAQQWVREFLEDAKPVAAICHAPWLLASADVIDGRKLTSYSTIRDDLLNAGADWVDKPVVVDSCLVTSRKPDDLPQFNDAIIDLIYRSNSVNESERQLHMASVISGEEED